MTIYLLAVLFCSILTASSIWATISAAAACLLFNYFFAEPFMTFYIPTVDYAFSLLLMLAAGLTGGHLAHRLKENARLSAQSAWQSQVLFESNQALLQARTTEEILDVTARQIQKLMDASILLYSVKKGVLQPAREYPKESGQSLNSGADEYAVASWVFRNNRKAGASTQTLSSSDYLYLAIRMEGKVWGVCGIDLRNQKLTPFLSSMLLSLLSESAMALEMRQNAKEKQEADQKVR